MKALRWHNRKDIRVENVPVPAPAEDEVLVEVKYSGICGSEVHEYSSGPIFIPIDAHPLTGSKAPQILGHEFGGRIVELGKGVHGIKTNDLVTVNPILSCGKCAACKKGRTNLCEMLAYYGLIGDGGHAEYCAVKAANCTLLPDKTPEEYVAFGEPAGVAYHAVNKAVIEPGSKVVVIGGGPIGMMVAQYANLIGLDKLYLIEIAPTRIEIAKKLDIFDGIYNPLYEEIQERIFQETNGEGVDFAFECSGGSKRGLLEDTAALAIELTRAEGKSIIVGTFSEPTEFHFNNIVLMEKIIMGSWIWQSQEEYDKAMEYVVNGKIIIDPLITSRIPIEKALSEGIEQLDINKDEHLKILIDFTKK